ncbi:MAG: hypothetical protein KDA42_19890, partial [Planctomycetales bacterium]|nr:hypothetical protein [Planctomycetales bacterium]
HCLRLQTPVVSVHRNPQYVLLKFANAPKQRFDRIVFATPADQALRLLADACLLERQTLSAFGYRNQTAILHRDPVRPSTRNERAVTWDYRLPADASASISLSYHLNPFQSGEIPFPLRLTLGDASHLDPQHILQRLEWRRPHVTIDTLVAQRNFAAINGRYRSYYCGAYWGHGFHEDAVRSAEQVADAIEAAAHHSMPSMPMPSATPEIVTNG